MKLYDIKQNYEDFKLAIGVKDNSIAKMLWIDMLFTKDDSITLSEKFENWINKSELARRYINM